MREVAIIAYAQTPLVRYCGSKNDVELVMVVVNDVKHQLGFTNQDIDFFCSGSCDYLGGSAFSFVNALDAPGAVPPINERTANINVFIPKPFIESIPLFCCPSCA